MDDFFVRGANGGHYPSEVCSGLIAFAVDEIVGAKANTALHRDQRVVFEVEVGSVYHAWFMVFLQDVILSASSGASCGR